MVRVHWALVPTSCCAFAARSDHRALGKLLCLFSRLVNLKVQGKCQCLFKWIFGIL